MKSNFFKPLLQRLPYKINYRPLPILTFGIFSTSAYLSFTDHGRTLRRTAKLDYVAFYRQLTSLSFSELPNSFSKYLIILLGTENKTFALLNLFSIAYILRRFEKVLGPRFFLHILAANLLANFIRSASNFADRKAEANKLPLSLFFSLVACTNHDLVLRNLPLFLTSLLLLIYCDNVLGQNYYYEVVATLLLEIALRRQIKIA